MEDENVRLLTLANKKEVDGAGAKTNCRFLVAISNSIRGFVCLSVRPYVRTSVGLLVRDMFLGNRE